VDLLSSITHHPLPAPTLLGKYHLNIHVQYTLSTLTDPRLYQGIHGSKPVLPI
jgi:hypothetical protein